MFKYIQLTLLLIILSGCVSLQVKPPLGRLYEVRKVSVAAMEAQPLEITLLSEELAHHGVTDEKTFDIMMSKEGEWVPTLVLAKEAVKQISVQGKYDVALLPGLQSYFGIENRSRTTFGENWQGPIRDWYNKESANSNYNAQLSQKTDLVVEVGLLNYAVTGARLVVQVCVKLIDVNTGQVIGKARAYDYPVVEPDVFSGNGGKFKYVVSLLAARLLNEDLKYLGLIM